MARPVRKPTDPVSVRFGREDRDLARTLRARANAHRRSLSEQIKYYAYLGMIAEDNPDVPLSLIEGILEAREELRAGLGEPYEWGVIEQDT
jgi:hypothetical protein